MISKVSKAPKVEPQSIDHYLAGPLPQLITVAGARPEDNSVWLLCDRNTIVTIACDFDPKVVGTVRSKLSFTGEKVFIPFTGTITLTV